ncbi:hypothetical protein [Lacticaseibacillus porcinae]|uniref:hypothetical protein n=1 Tax=Lacticaseibacillus porcinae TaxID=1123687 RepID=UPI000F776969|nr:hypothetical protein [Lacticaseibacillus porcinae]
MAKSDKIIIDPETFARTILASNPKGAEEDNRVYIKRQLRLYLEALLMIQDFNNLENTQFDIAKEDQRAKILQKIMEHRY